MLSMSEQYKTKRRKRKRKEEMQIESMRKKDRKLVFYPLGMIFRRWNTPN